MRRLSFLLELLHIATFAAICGAFILPLLRPPEPTPIDQPEPEFEFPSFRDYTTPPPRLRPKPPEHVASLLDSIYEQLAVTHSYDPAYVKIAYPDGDVPMETGVCTDVIVRAFRAQGVDLQQSVHEDMRRHFRKYPRKWGLRTPDTNIDHRRVPNLMTYFERKGFDLPVSNTPDDYLPGDVVAWKLNEKQFHIGIVMKARSHDEMRPLIGHNINAGVLLQDALFNWEIVGHYRYFDAPVQQADVGSR